MTSTRAQIPILLAGLAVFSLISSCGGNRADGPAAGSTAADMCDVNERGPDIVVYKGVGYNRKCLRAYSWEPRK